MTDPEYAPSPFSPSADHVERYLATDGADGFDVDAMIAEHRKEFDARSARFTAELSILGQRVTALQKAIDADLGGYDKFKADFIAAGTTQFGSGWAWLSVKDGKLAISKTPNGENPLVHGATPILGVDVWEHSYYIDYRNARPKYLEAFVDNLINWDYVLECYEKASA